MVRNVLLVMHGVGWLIAVLAVASKTGSVPAELWTVLPLGVSAILMAFRAGGDDPDRHRKRSPKHRSENDQ
jgi:hypothetical protein